MPASPSTRRRAYVFIGAAALLVVLIGVAGRLASTRSQSRLVPIAAFLVPVDNPSQIRLSWWRSTALTLPMALPSGRSIKIPQGARVRIIHAATGTAEVVAGPAELTLQQKAPGEPDALVSPLREVIPLLREMLGQRRNAFCITSPVGVTRFLNPPVTWTARDGVEYDLAIADPGDPNAPVRLARRVRPPVSVSEFETTQRRYLYADRNYELVVRVAGAPLIAGSSRFLAVPEATADARLPETPAELVAEAAAAMSRKPTRTGDAWLALSKLPDDWSRSELGVRLRLRVAAELGLGEVFEAAEADAAALPGP